MKYILPILLLFFLSAPLQAKSDSKSVEIIKAAYIPFADNSNSEIDGTFANLPENVIYSIQQICQWSQISKLIKSGNADVVLVMSPSKAKKLFSHPQFRFNKAIKSELDKLAKLYAVNSIPEKSGKPRQITKKFQKIINTRLKIIKRYANNPFIINAVNKANATDMTLEQIKELDSQWINNTSKHADKITSNDVSKFLRKKVISNKLLYTEAFLCGRRGTTLGTYPATSDYWQGDEEKFTECFSKAKTFIGPLRFDKSTESYAVQVSVPVKDSGEVIGVLVMGLRNIK